MKKGIKILIIVFLILLILICGGLAFAYFGTDLFKSDKEMFFKYLGTSNELLEVLQDDSLTAYREKQKNTPYTNNGEIKVDYTNYDALSEAQQEALQNYNITFEGTKNATNKVSQQNIKINYSDTENVDLEYFSQNDTYGIKINNILEKYLAVENNNLKQWGEALGLSAERIESLPDKIDFSSTSSEPLFTDEELETIKNTYSNVLTENLDDSMFSKETVSDDTVYKLQMNTDQLKTIVIKILETLKQDTLVKGKIQEVINQSSPSATVDLDTTIQQMIDSLNQESTSTEVTNLSITLNVQKRKLYQIILGDDKGDQISLIQNNNGIEVQTSMLEDSTGSTNTSQQSLTDTQTIGTTQTTSQSITINKEKSSDSLIYNITLNPDTSSNKTISLQLQYTGIDSLNTVAETCTYTDNYTLFELSNPYTISNSTSSSLDTPEARGYEDNLLIIRTMRQSIESKTIDELPEMTLEDLQQGFSIYSNVEISQNADGTFALTDTNTGDVYTIFNDWTMERAEETENTNDSEETATVTATYKNTKTFDANAVTTNIGEGDMLVLNGYDAEYLQNLYVQMSTRLTQLNDTQMQQIGLTGEDNPISYYLPGILPTAVMGILNSNMTSAAFGGAFLAGMGLSIYSSAYSSAYSSFDSMDTQMTDTNTYMDTYTDMNTDINSDMDSDMNMEVTQ